jgi:hypothetical protein
MKARASEGKNMLIKQADDKSARLAALEARMGMPGDAGKQAKSDYYRLKAGIKGEQDSAYFIDFHYGESSKNWAVIHDLRLEHGGRVVQIDHLLLNRFSEIYVLETKQFNSGIKITEEGEFLRWNDYRKTYEGMESPLLQNERHIAVLKDVCGTLELPVRLGIRLQPDFQSLVLIANNAKIFRPSKSAFDTSRVIKADQLRSRIDKDIEGESGASILLKAPKMVSSETVRDLAMQLVARHTPLVRPIDRVEPTPVAAPAQESTKSSAQGPTCKGCQGGKGSILYGQYGYYFKCDACGTNTAIRFACQPGHKPRLRKAGSQFFRNCAECKISTLYFTNPGKS